MDPTENRRRHMAQAINSVHGDRAQLEAEYGRVWNSDELIEDFNVISFAAPFIVVRRRVDGAIGSMYFQHSPRFYWGFMEDK